MQEALAILSSVIVANSLLLQLTSVFVFLKTITMCCRRKRRTGGSSSKKSLVSKASARQKQVESTGTASVVPTSARAGKQQGLSSTRGTDTLKLRSCPRSEPFLPYPEVKSPSESAKQRRQEELEKDKRQKIAEGFYQERSDLDDTLAEIESLKMESTEYSTARQRRPRRKRKTESVEELATARLPD